jgi:hypothetical protein
LVQKFTQRASKPARKLRAGFESRPTVSRTGGEAEAWEIPRVTTTTRAAKGRRARMTVSFREASTPVASMAAESRLPVQKVFEVEKTPPRVT